MSRAQGKINARNREVLKGVAKFVEVDKIHFYKVVTITKPMTLFYTLENNVYEGTIIYCPTVNLSKGELSVQTLLNLLEQKIAIVSVKNEF